MASSQTLIESGIITLARASLFLACNHYLHRSLYHNLRHLSSSDTIAGFPATPTHERNLSANYDTELDELPTPVTARSHDSSLELPRPGVTNRRWHSSLSTWTFALCFSESCTLFLLVLSQAIGLFSERARYVNWKISLTFLLSAILLVAPLQQCYLITSKTSQGQSRGSPIRHIIFTGIPYLLYLFVLSHVPLPLDMASSAFGASTLARLVLVGTIILGLLAGFGAVSAFFSYFRFLRAPAEVYSEAQLAAAEQALVRVKKDLLERRQHVERNSQQPEAENSQGFFSRMNPFAAESEMSSIRREIRGLEALEHHMGRDLESKQQRRLESLYAQTFRGRIWLWIGKLFALYCAFRVINSIINLLYPLSSSKGVSTPDLITSLLTRLFSVFYPVSEKAIAAASRQFSLLLVGAIILTSVRRALRGVTRVLKVTSRNTAASLLLLILAQLMGIYLLSTLIQIRTSFPAPSPEENHINLFETLPQFHVFGPLWDGSFLISVGLTGFAKWFDDKINGPTAD